MTSKSMDLRGIVTELAWALATVGVVASAGCATVRPEQRAILADPTMQFDVPSAEQAALEHTLDNREGSTGGGAFA